MDIRFIPLPKKDVPKLEADALNATRELRQLIDGGRSLLLRPVAYDPSDLYAARLKLSLIHI